MVDLISSTSPVGAALLATIPMYLIIACGWMSRRLGWVTPEMDRGFMRVAIDLCFPCFIWDKMFGNKLLASPSFSLSVAGVGAGILLLSLLVSFIIASLLGLKVGEGKRTFTLASSVQNYGFLVIPMIAVLYDAPGDPTMGVLLTHNVGVEFTLWTVGLIVMSEGMKISPRLLLRGPILAVIIGLLLVWTGGDTLIPSPLRATMSMLGACAVPLSIFMVGTCFYDLWGKSRWSKRIAVGSILVRCGILPIMILALAYVLPVDIVLKRILIFQAAVPSAIIPIVLAQHYGGQPSVAIEIALCTTMASLISMPLWLTLGFQYIPH